MTSAGSQQIDEFNPDGPPRALHGWRQHRLQRRLARREIARERLTPPHFGDLRADQPRSAPRASDRASTVDAQRHAVGEPAFDAVASDDAVPCRRSRRRRPVRRSGAPARPASRPRTCPRPQSCGRTARTATRDRCAAVSPPFATSASTGVYGKIERRHRRQPRHPEPFVTRGALVHGRQALRRPRPPACPAARPASALPWRTNSAAGSSVAPSSRHTRVRRTSSVPVATRMP